MNAVHQFAEIGDDRRSLRLKKPLPESVKTGIVDVVIMFSSPEDHYDAEAPDEDETEYLLKSTANRERILKSIDDIEHGRNIVSFGSIEDAIKAAQKKGA